MSNVLPENEQRIVRRLYRTRLIAVGSLIAIGAAALGSLALVPSYVAMRTASAPLTAQIASKGGVNEADIAQLDKTQAVLDVIMPVLAATTSPSATITTALALRPGGITIDSIVYSSDGASSKILLNGSTPRRESLSSYRDALIHSPYFTNAIVPLSDLAGAAGGQFSITLMAH